MAEPYTIWHNPRCSTSRFVLSALRDAGIQPQVRDYLKDPPSVTELRAALKVMSTDARGLLRTKEALYGELGLNDPALDDDALLTAMAEHPRLIDRPVVFGPEVARLCRPKEAVFDIIPPVAGT